MGLLDELLAGVTAGAQGSGRSQRAPTGGGAGMNSSVLMALLPVILSMLASRGGAGPSSGTGGGLGDILGQMLGGGAPGRGTGGMGDILGQVLGGGARGGGGMGGLGELLDSLQRAGHGDAARSWVGKGQNMPISPDVIGQVFGRSGLEAIARHAGVSEAEASEGLSQLLPEVVDRVTPNGDVPDLDSLVASVDAMSRRYGFR
jgi:uncharacterized protein YidB (DUF937 family)